MTTIKLDKITGKNENGEDIIETKTYFAPNPKARMVRKAAEMIETLNIRDLRTSDLDMIVDYVVELFAYKFTADELWDGLSAENLTPTVMACINSVMGDLNKKLGAIPNVRAE
ncbi:MAG: hypothetical protein A2Y15_08725 [Clostridiales bacterium GWF2_36_10]|nr:MAG: hypothetical protein A2Y15_08725 [Clostridiales bacterium GWF2_36_10]HAN20427.1 hypothetical protein [Clostridiales bacterium]